MAIVKLRLARGGSKKRPHYSIVAAKSTAPRDGAFIEKLGYYNPLLQKDNPQRVVLKIERVEAWLKVGAQPTEKVAKFLKDRTELLPVKLKQQISKTAPVAPAA